LRMPEHKRMEERIHSIVPKSSVVGMLLEHEENYTVVDSSQLGFMQHDGFSWSVMGDHFVTLRQVTRQSHLSDLALQEWLLTLSGEQREAFVDALFKVLTASGAVTLTDLKSEKFKAAGAMVRAMKDLDKDSRDRLISFFSLMFKSNMLLVLEDIHEGSEKIAHTAKKWAFKRIAEEKT